MSAVAQAQTIPCYQLRFWFVGGQPIVWRRLLLRADNTLADLHYAIQITCDWSDYFLHQFNIHGKTIGVRRIHGPYYSQSAAKVTLADLKLREKERFVYEYNFFDNWQLEIRLEKKCDLDARHYYPLCIAGKRAAPPESCGGPDHFNQLRDHFSPYYIVDQALAWYQLYERREQLSEDELYELEDRRLELSGLLGVKGRKRTVVGGVLPSLVAATLNFCVQWYKHVSFFSGLKEILWSTMHSKMFG